MPLSSLRAALIAAGAALALTPAAAGAAAQCQAEKGGVCGHVTVPLDRSQQGGATIDIQYVVFKHKDASKPTAGTIFVTEGGPGYSALNNMQAAYLALFDPVRSDHDLVLIDQRGVGRSGAIDCEPLQQDPEALYAAAASCGQHLGATSDLYGSADVARDIEAVRVAVGVDQFDFYGGSNAGMDVQAYAARFPAHLRSVILDSPVVLSVEGPWFAAEAAQSVEVVRRVCSRSASCSSANPHAVNDLVALIHRLRSKPVKGTGRDPRGGKHKLTVTEGRLARMLQSSTYVVQAEIAAAEKALRHGDKAPLLRLAAENDQPLFNGDPSDPTLFSVGDNVSRFCTDQAFQWDKQASVEDRRTQFASARAALPANAFAPFSVAAWVQPAPLGPFPDPCIEWPAPTHQSAPPVPAGTVNQSVPALVLIGDLDLNVPPAESAQANKQFPQSTIVTLDASGHHTAFNSRFECAAKLINRFVSKLDAGDTGCAKKPPVEFPAVGRFPLRAGRSRAQVARVTAATILDVIQRSFIGGNPDGVGLRGGSFKAKFGPNGATYKLGRVRFARDLAVSGKIAYSGYAKIDATVKVRGGTVRVRGIWYSAGATRLQVTGKLRGRRVSLSVPAT